MSTRSVGNSAESFAVKHLNGIGYQVIDRNYQIRGGEIDIVAKDKETLVFVEVKARWSHKFGLPVESLTPWKIKALLKTALFYTQKINWGDRPYRIDSLLLDFTQSREDPKIELIKNITF